MRQHDFGKTGQESPEKMIVLPLNTLPIGLRFLPKKIKTSLEKEGIELTEKDENGKPIMDASDKPLMVTKLYASSSRLMALMGTIVILLMFLAFGSFSLFAFAKTGEMPKSINEVVKFLVAGLTLFAPYAVNKFSKLFEGLSPKG